MDDVGGMGDGDKREDGGGKGENGICRIEERRYVRENG